MLAGFATPTGGEARVGGVELADLDGDALREAVRWIPQDPHVFATTIAANVRIASPAPTTPSSSAPCARSAPARGSTRCPTGSPRGSASRASAARAESASASASRARTCAAARLVILDEPAATCRDDEALEALSAVMDVDPSRGVLLVTHRREEVDLASREVRLGL